MKTILELRNEGLISIRVYHMILRYAANEINYLCEYKRLDRICGRTIDTNEILNMTIKDLFDLLGEDRISHWRGLGQKGLSELKGLI